MCVCVCVCVCVCLVCACPETVSAVLKFTFCSYCNHNQFTCMDVCICDSLHVCVCEYTEYRHTIVILMFVCVRVYQHVHLCKNINAVLMRL